MKILLINGPNLNLLGKREIDIYGNKTINDIENLIKKKFNEKANITFYQSNNEGDIINYIQKAYKDSYEAIIINAGAYTHTSIAILDALNIFNGKIIEIHISNIYRRENFRHKSYISKRADAIIIGLGIYGYLLAVDYLINN
ncbi:3-dehydroquinate dehydratase [Candidatus Johnevansia muelleri]|uniref:3-dehydroquinate dehydratase n=1 Tax=Candidatus Johnevansia muelleri TaxID=1495769 RepID=A0A078KDL8_9GAMM|nr:3-dehydroquinate dehydratase [Candidatus Evansia muelleri]